MKYSYNETGRSDNCKLISFQHWLTQLHTANIGSKGMLNTIKDAEHPKQPAVTSNRNKVKVSQFQSQEKPQDGAVPTTSYTKQWKKTEISSETYRLPTTASK